MKKKTRKQYIQNASTLRLPIDFGKAKYSEDTLLAYSILCMKKTGKSKMILNAIKHYEETGIENTTFDLYCQELEHVKYIKERFNINSRENLEQFLNIDKRKVKYKALENSNRLLLKAPTKMLCGFTKGNEEFEEMHDYLFQMSMNERISVITKAVLKYEKDGYLPKGRRMISYKYMKEIIDVYQESEDSRKEEILDKLYKLMILADEINR